MLMYKMCDEEKTCMFTNRDRKYLLDKITSLDAMEHLELFKIIKHKQPDIAYTINANGLFINMSTMNDEVLQQIDAFVSFCVENKKQLDEYDQRVQECKFTKLYDTLAAASADGTPSQQGDHIASQESPASRTLQTILTPDYCEQEWIAIARKTGQEEGFIKVLDACQTQADRVIRKKVQSKYNLAKKKYARRVLSDRKLDTESVTNMLEPEGYM